MKNLLTTALIIFLSFFYVHVSAQAKQKNNKMPLIVVNGMAMNSTFNIDALNKEYIESIYVFKDKKEIEKYGDDGKNGVIGISLKANKLKQNANSPLIVLNGKSMDEKFATNAINPDYIETINILKGDIAIATYGNDAENGVIVITLKKRKNHSYTEINIEDCESEDENILSYQYQAKLSGKVFIKQYPIEVESELDLIKIKVSATVSEGSFSIKITNPKDKDIIGDTHIEDGGMNINKTIEFDDKKSSIGSWIILLKSDKAVGNYSISFKGVE